MLTRKNTGRIIQNMKPFKDPALFVTLLERNIFLLPQYAGQNDTLNAQDNLAII